MPDLSRCSVARVVRFHGHGIAFVDVALHLSVVALRVQRVLGETFLLKAEQSDGLLVIIRKLDDVIFPEEAHLIAFTTVLRCRLQDRVSACFFG